ncbi:hypothetical protein EUX98_g4690 [Antrodiella citrinella]|uniref:USP domain-containing protein n=1 Tax=Antrodiella citrinella TaxID=2447956 RepID=A0A4S4MTJ4_9APHY|nr:hypothetical protein EUX98_g4690 [Antrodiella citrinella]
MAVTDPAEGSFSSKFTPAPPTAQENTDVGMLLSVMEHNGSYDAALRILRRCGGDLDKALMIFEAEQIVPRTPPPSKPERGSPPVIDLTGDGEDALSRALELSLRDQPTFGPSDRAPDPSWAVVPSNVEVNTSAAAGLSQEEQHLNRAIEASLTYEMLDTFEDVPVEERVRTGDAPVSLRPTQPVFAYAGLIIHGLFFVPQVKHAIARWVPVPEGVDEFETEINTHPPRSGPDHLLWTLLEAFANMDLARTTELSVDEALEAFVAEPWKNPAESPGDVAFQFYSKLSWTVEAVLNRNSATDSSREWPRLFHFRYGFSDSAGITGPFDSRYDMSIVRVSVPGTPDANDLLSCLALELSPGSPKYGREQVIFEPSEVVAFQLHRTHVSTGGKNDRTTFRFPKFVYLDQFLKENATLAAERKNMRNELFAEIDVLKKRKDALTTHNNRDVFADLRSAVHYYENIAEDIDDDIRKDLLRDSALKLRKILTKVENELQTIDLTIAKHQVKAASAYDCPELQKHRYDLRVVLVHDGLYGRNHIYSYVKQRDVWWKTVDYKVTQETVFTDPVGLHLNAGPFLMLYSHAMSAEEENARAPYPDGVKDSVKHNNISFLSSLPPEIQAKTFDPNSPPSTPAFPISQVPSLSSSIAEPSASPRLESMDLDD